MNTPTIVDIEKIITQERAKLARQSEAAERTRAHIQLLEEHLKKGALPK